MSILFENLMFCIFIVANFIWLVQIWKTTKTFSISEKLKLEIKSTTKNSRTHHFRHEQLMTELYNIYVLSYMFRYDDEGLSLWELILESKLT